MRTAVVILNWNTKDYLERFLPGVISGSGPDAEVVVVDNASTDGSVDLLHERFPQVRTICLDKNYGFTGGYNRGLAQLEGYEYFVLLNSDIETPQGWLDPLVEWMDAHPECGACGPKLHSLQEREKFEYAGAAGGFLDRYGYPFCRGRAMNLVETDEGQYDAAPKDVFWVTGACLLVRASLFDGLDGRFFAHMEEIDLCWRLQRKGFRITVIPSSTVYHLGGGTLPVRSPFKLMLNFRNNLLLLDNNLPAGSRCIIPLRMLLDACSAAVYLLSGRWQYFKAVIRAHREFRSLRRKEVPEYDITSLQGYYRGWIIPRILLRGNRIFTLIHSL